jgi:hypothetical protein
MGKEDWYSEGLQFECSQCGDCCTGEPGYVWVTNKEIADLAREKGSIEITEFEQEFVRKVGIRKSLKEFANGDCVFFDNKKRRCTVYAARPRQCRTWPFWDSNLKSPESWRETCEVCPGSGKGKLHTWDEIEEQRKIVKV